MNMKNRLTILLLITFLTGCGKKDSPDPPVGPTIKVIAIQDLKLNNIVFNNNFYGSNRKPVFRLQFNEPAMQSTVATSVKITDVNGNDIAVNYTSQNKDSVLLVQPVASLDALSKYWLKVSTSLKSASGGGLSTALEQSFITQIDSTRKFPIISDNALLDLVQQTTFKYFWDFGHPVSGFCKRKETRMPTCVLPGVLVLVSCR